MGVDCFKTDFGERVPVDVEWFDGSDQGSMHNYYTYLYNQCVFNLLKEVKGEGEAVLFARSAAAGGQQFQMCIRDSFFTAGLDLISGKQLLPVFLKLCISFSTSSSD